MLKIKKYLLLGLLCLMMTAMSASLAIGDDGTPIASSSLSLIGRSVTGSTHLSLWNESDQTLADLPYMITDLLFGGDPAYLTAAKIILTVIAVSAGVIPLAVIRASHMAIIAIAVSILIFCVVVGWCDIWVLLFIAMIMAALWGRKISDWLYGEGD